jgi:hypothetical protein
MFYGPGLTESEAIVRFEGTFWLLWEDEPLSPTSTRFFEFREGLVFDARTDVRCGTYGEVSNGIDALFDEQHGEREVVKFRMSHRAKQWGGKFVDATPEFDPECESYALTFSTARYEAYVAARPANDFETDEEADERKDREIEEFGITPMFGCAWRDCTEVRAMGDANERSANAHLRREHLKVV